MQTKLLGEKKTKDGEYRTVVQDRQFVAHKVCILCVESAVSQVLGQYGNSQKPMNKLGFKVH